MKSCLTTFNIHWLRQHTLIQTNRKRRNHFQDTSMFYSSLFHVFSMTGKSVTNFPGYPKSQVPRSISSSCAACHSLIFTTVYENKAIKRIKQNTAVWSVLCFKWKQQGQVDTLNCSLATLAHPKGAGSPLLWSAVFGPRPLVRLLQLLQLSERLVTFPPGSRSPLIPIQWLPGEADGWALFMKLLPPQWSITPGSLWSAAGRQLLSLFHSRRPREPHVQFVSAYC